MNISSWEFSRDSVNWHNVTVPHDGAIANGFAQVMDVPGYNYRVHRYDDGIKSLPQQFLLGSETASTVSSRGVYKFPIQLRPGVTFNRMENQVLSLLQLKIKQKEYLQRRLLDL